jgi:hypothetical protein
MPLSAVLLPLFAQVFLTFALLLFRGAPSFSQKIEPGNRAPSGLLQFGGSTQNGFELPFMFYLLVLLVILAKKDDFTFVVMEWAFVALALHQRLPADALSSGSPPDAFPHRRARRAVRDVGDLRLQSVNDRDDLSRFLRIAIEARTRRARAFSRQ